MRLLLTAMVLAAAGCRGAPAAPSAPLGAPRHLPSVRFAISETPVSDAPGGRRLGRLLAGGQVFVEAVEADWAGFEISLPGSERLRAWVPLAALRSEPLGDPPVLALWGDRLEDRVVSLRAEEHAPAFATIRCAPIVVREVSGARVASHRVGPIVLEGIVGALRESADPTCLPPPPPPRPEPPPPPPLPSGYVASDPGLAAQSMRAALHDGGTVFQLVGPRSHEVCRRARVVSESDGGDPVHGTLIHERRRRGGRWEFSVRGFRLSGTTLYVSSPSTHVRQGRNGPVIMRQSMLCGGSAREVVAGDEVRWLCSSDPLAERGYDPAHLERWYATAVACEADRRERKESFSAGCGG